VVPPPLERILDGNILHGELHSGVALVFSGYLDIVVNVAAAPSFTRGRLLKRKEVILHVFILGG